MFSAFNGRRRFAGPGGSTSQRGLSRLRAVGAAALVSLCMACAQIPTSGVVQEGVDEVSVPRSGYLIASGPTAGADQLEIVQGFLRALSAGPEDDYAVAREYLLDDEVRRTWDPADRVVLHPTSSSLEPVLEADGSAQLTMSISATLDRAGRFSPAGEGVVEEFTFVLQRDVNDEWRIAAAPNVTLMSVANFDFLFRPTPIYFASQDLERFIPELRWFSERNQAAAAAATVLNGPSSWLQEAVYSGVPLGVRLTAEGIVINDGVAIVSLSEQILNSPLEDRAVLVAELEQTLTRVPNVHSVELRSGGAELNLETALPTIDSEPTPSGSLTALGLDDEGDQILMEYVSGAFTTREGLDFPAEEVHDFAISLTSEDVIAVTTAEGVLRLGVDAEPVTLLVDDAIASLSWDRWDWLWLAREGSGSQLIAINTDGEYQDIAVDWLEGRTLHEARVARDGSRILLISSNNSNSSIDIAAIIRDDSGHPQALGEPLQVGGNLKNPASAVWVDNLLIAALAEGNSGGDVSPYLIEVGGRINSLPSVEDARWLASGKGERNLFLGSDGGRIYMRDGQTWSPIADDITDPHFPG